MKPYIKVGLLVGVIGLVLNTCIAAGMGICGPLFSLLAGAAAGYFTAAREKAATKGDGARLGLISGGIAGALIVVGQVLGGIGSLVLVQASGMKLPFGTVPAMADGSQSAIYYLSGVGTALCFGIIGMALAALVGAGVAYLTTSAQPQPPDLTIPPA
jgi:hypothetical protein